MAASSTSPSSAATTTTAAAAGGRSAMITKRALLLIVGIIALSCPALSADAAIVVARRGIGYGRVVAVSRFNVFRPGVVVGRRSLTAAQAPASGAADPNCKTVLQILDATPELSKLKDVATKHLTGKQLDELKGLGTSSFTLFAPNNDAIDDLVEALGPEVGSNATIAATILAYHIIPGAAAKSTDLKNGQKLTTGLSGKGSPVSPLTVDLTKGVIIKGVGSEAKVVKADVQACKGVVHIIDTVLLPVDVSGAMAPAMMNPK